jgi:hypothetical protein
LLTQPCSPAVLTPGDFHTQPLSIHRAVCYQDTKSPPLPHQAEQPEARVETFRFVAFDKTSQHKT